MSLLHFVHSSNSHSTTCNGRAKNTAQSERYVGAIQLKKEKASNICE
jgi:hypothetical protein